MGSVHGPDIFYSFGHLGPPQGVGGLCETIFKKAQVLGAPQAECHGPAGYIAVSCRFCSGMISEAPSSPPGVMLKSYFKPFEIVTS